MERSVRSDLLQQNRRPRKSAFCKGAKLIWLQHNVWIGRTTVFIGVKQVSTTVALYWPHSPTRPNHAKRYAHALHQPNHLPAIFKARQVLGPVAHIDSLDVVARLKQQSRGQSAESTPPLMPR